METWRPAQSDTIPVHSHSAGVSPLQWTPLLGAGSQHSVALSTRQVHWLARCDNIGENISTPRKSL